MTAVPQYSITQDSFAGLVIGFFKHCMICCLVQDAEKVDAGPTVFKKLSVRVSFCVMRPELDWNFVEDVLVARRVSRGLESKSRSNSRTRCFMSKIQPASGFLVLRRFLFDFLMRFEGNRFGVGCFCCLSLTW